MGGHGGSSGYAKVKNSNPLGLSDSEVASAYAGVEIKLGKKLTKDQRRAVKEIAELYFTEKGKTADGYGQAKKEVFEKYGIEGWNPGQSLFAQTPQKAVNMVANKLIEIKEKKNLEEVEKKQSESIKKIELDGGKQPATGKGVPEYNNTKTQKGHVQKYDAFSLAQRTGVTTERAQDFIDAVYEQGVGGFTRGWDSVIRAYQRGASATKIMSMTGSKSTLATKFGGDFKKYFAALKKKANDCEELIDRSPKWNGKELHRGFKYLDDSTLKALTNTSGGTLINLNAGTASWSTKESVARGFAGNGYGGNSLVAHVSGKRRGTSVKKASYYTSEDEVLCSKREAFVCTKVKKVGNVYHAWYDVVDTDYDWS